MTTINLPLDNGLAARFFTDMAIYKSVGSQWSLAGLAGVGV
jgi:hypothetical protein